MIYGSIHHMKEGAILNNIVKYSIILIIIFTTGCLTHIDNKKENCTYEAKYEVLVFAPERFFKGNRYYDRKFEAYVFLHELGHNIIGHQNHLDNIGHCSNNDCIMNDGTNNINYCSSCLEYYQKQIQQNFVLFNNDDGFFIIYNDLKNYLKEKIIGEDIIE